LKFAVIITLKKDVLDPQGKVIQQTLQGIGINTIKNLRQGKYIEIQLNETDESKAHSIVENMCKKLLVNLIIEEYEIKKI
jgi:phosphoribosylformylglycinamidine synthase PurS subunit